MRVLCCGDRNWGDRAYIKRVLLILPESPSCIIDGACRGADSLAHDVAKELGIPTERYPAEWFKFGKKAGILRNERMLRESRPDLVIAFHDDLERSKGTRDMVKRAYAAGVGVLKISHV